MSEYLMGLATLPALAILVALVLWLASPPSWDSKGPCPWCEAGKTWTRDDHPARPWWAWEIDEWVHKTRYRERAQIKAWQAEHTEKRHWWSRRIVVR